MWIDKTKASAYKTEETEYMVAKRFFWRHPDGDNEADMGTM